MQAPVVLGAQFLTFAGPRNWSQNPAPVISNMDALLTTKTELFAIANHVRITVAVASTAAVTVALPVLIQICEKDSLVPPATLNESIKKLGDLAEVMRYPIGHFDIYFDNNFEKAVADQLAFFRKHLL